MRQKYTITIYNINNDVVYQKTFNQKDEFEDEKNQNDSLSEIRSIAKNMLLHLHNNKEGMSATLSSRNKVRFVYFITKKNGQYAVIEHSSLKIKRRHAKGMTV